MKQTVRGLKLAAHHVVEANGLRRGQQSDVFADDAGCQGAAQRADVKDPLMGRW